VAEAIAAADDAVELSATWSLAGPTRLTFDELVDAVHGGPVAKRHLDGAASGGDGGSGGGGTAGSRAELTAVQLGVLAADSLPDLALPVPPGQASTPLAETLGRSAGPV
jgi:hypothetical protein